jgi:hypothetical protein
MHVMVGSHVGGMIEERQPDTAMHHADQRLANTHGKGEHQDDTTAVFTQPRTTLAHTQVEELNERSKALYVIDCAIHILVFTRDSAACQAVFLSLFQSTISFVRHSNALE